MVSLIIYNAIGYWFFLDSVVVCVVRMAFSLWFGGWVVLGNWSVEALIIILDISGIICRFSTRDIGLLACVSVCVLSLHLVKYVHRIILMGLTEVIRCGSLYKFSRFG